VGDVLDSNDDGSGHFSQTTLQRVRVVEVFKGVPDDVEEIWVDPGSMSSCYAPLTVGRRWLIEAGPARQFKDEQFLMQPPRKPWPVGFRLGASWVVSAPMCGNSAVVENAGDDLEFLRAQQAGKWKSRVIGRLEQSKSTQYGGPGLENAQIRVTGAAGTRVAMTDAAGQFTLAEMPPGEYRVDSAKAGYGQGESMKTVTVAPGGCGWWRGAMTTNGRVAVRLVSRQGLPVTGVEVVLLYLNRGSWSSWREAQSNAAGLAEFREVPAATYIVAVNVYGQTPHLRLPYRTNYLPGVSEQDKALRVTLGPNEARLDLRMTLPEPIARRRVEVLVVNEAGVPQAGAKVTSETGGRAETDAKGVAVMTTLALEGEKIQAFLAFDNSDAGRAKPWEQQKHWTGAARVEGVGDARVVLRFETWAWNNGRPR